MAASIETDNASRNSPPRKSGAEILKGSVPSTKQSRKLPANASIGSKLDNDKSLNEQRRSLDRRSTDTTAKGKAAPLAGSPDSNGKKAEKKDEKHSALEEIRQRQELRLQQHRRKKLLAGCEPVLGLSYDFLAMDDYPENLDVAQARQFRDYWLLLCGICFMMFVAGLYDLVPAWLSGSGFGLFVASLLFAFKPLRAIFFKRPSLSELLEKRKLIEFRALNHIRLLEGRSGLAWRCEKLAKYNHNLNNKLFQGVIRLSKQGRLLGMVRERKHIRLYLLFMIEAQKAYKRLENDYLKLHFDSLEQGINDAIDEAEAEKLEGEIGEQLQFDKSS